MTRRRFRLLYISREEFNRLPVLFPGTPFSMGQRMRHQLHVAGKSYWVIVEKKPERSPSGRLLNHHTFLYCPIITDP